MKRFVKRAAVALVLLATAGGAAYWYLRVRTTTPEPTVMRAAVTRGAVSETVGATGTLQAVTTVQVGTQVSGIVQELYADFNSLVKKGQVIARLDPSTIETQIQQAEANLVRARADRDRLTVQLDDARRKLQRTEDLHSKNLLPTTELEAAQMAVKTAESSLKSADASVGQSEASLNQNKVNLGYTIITAPIDGLVISRNVDRGQTVAASMNAPVLFTLAADLTKMQLISNIDESDVGRIRPNQAVRFRVDAFPAEEFTGRVSQVRLNPIVQQGVVSYATVIDVENLDLKLKPGMTANVTIEIARREDVLRIPNAALRFRPTNDVYTALGLTPPGTAPSRDAQADGPTNGERGGGAGRATGRANSGMAPGAGRGRGLQNLSPEEREEMLRAMRGRGGAAGAVAEPPPAASTRPRVAPAGATTIDALFGPLPVTESRGQVWIYADNQLRPVRVRLGITDGQVTEMLEGDLQEGVELVTNVVTAAATRPGFNPNQQFNPFMGGRGPGGPGGFGPGGPGGGGGGGGSRDGGGRR
jgi:HlyD family secretion protein